MKQISMLDLKLDYEYMKKEIDSAIQRCLEHQQWILGPEVKDLESKIAEYLGVKHCIGVILRHRIGYNAKLDTLQVAILYLKFNLLTNLYREEGSTPIFKGVMQQINVIVKDSFYGLLARQKSKNTNQNTFVLNF